MRKIILVNGIPASGKSFMAKKISQFFDAPILSIDEIKEPFMKRFRGDIDRQLNRMLGSAAYEAMFRIIAASPEDTLFIADAWFGFRDKKVLEEYLKMAGCQKIIEVWNKISADTVSSRYYTRCSSRVKGHPGEEYIPELINLSESATPMAFGPVYTIDQDDPSDDQIIMNWLSQHLNCP